MVLELEWPPKLEDSLLPEEELKAEKLFQHKFSMVKLESLKKSNQFKKALKEKKVHSDFFSIFAAKNFYKPKFKADLMISFVMKKKLEMPSKETKLEEN